MDTTTYIVLSAVLGTFALVIHIPSVFSHGWVATVCTIFNILVHLAFTLTMFLAGAKLDILTLSIMASIAVYSVLSYIGHSLARRTATDKEGEV